MTMAKHLPTLDYRLLITPTFNEREQRYKTLLLLETTQLFSTFTYDLSVREEQTERALSLTVLGLKTPQLSLPRAGHAQFVREYDGLRGTYEITIKGLDGRTNSFWVRISEKKVALLKASPKRFVEVFVDKSHWLSH
jgi:hypothetical protein